MDGLFHIIEDAQIVLRNRGVYRQSKLYHRNGLVYAGLGSGFVRLTANNGTSHPNVTWEGRLPPDVETSVEHFCLRYHFPKRVAA